MKFMLAGLLLAALIASRPRPAQPYVVSQVSKMVLHDRASPTWERHIKIRNPLDRAVWVYIECESRLTSNPIGIPGRKTDEVVFPDIPPGEGCLINHWGVQVAGKSPPEWRP